MQEYDFGQAVIEGDDIVIRVHIEHLDKVVECMPWDGWEKILKVTDCKAFAKDLLSTLNDEEEDGTTRIHRMFDEAIEHAAEYGADGIDEIDNPDY